MRSQTAMQIASHAQGMVSDLHSWWVFALRSRFAWLAHDLCIILHWLLDVFETCDVKFWESLSAGCVDRNYSLERNQIIQIWKIAHVTRNEVLNWHNKFQKCCQHLQYSSIIFVPDPNHRHFISTNKTSLHFGRPSVVTRQQCRRFSITFPRRRSCVRYSRQCVNSGFE